MLVKVIGNRATFNALLYKGDFIKKNVEQSYYDYYSEAFKKLFTTAPAKRTSFCNYVCLERSDFPREIL